MISAIVRCRDCSRRMTMTESDLVEKLRAMREHGRLAGNVDAM